jgi:hypothetical protein
MFPDAKLTNWLVNEEGKLILADTKSFVFVDARGNYSNSLPGNEHTGLLQTSVFRPLELGGGSANADGVHAYILGKNLHSFLTGKFKLRIRVPILIFPAMYSIPLREKN